LNFHPALSKTHDDVLRDAGRHRELDGPLAWMNDNRLIGLTELPVKAFPR